MGQQNQGTGGKATLEFGSKPCQEVVTRLKLDSFVLQETFCRGLSVAKSQWRNKVCAEMKRFSKLDVS